MKHKTKLLALLMAAIMILTAVSLASCLPEDDPIETDTEEATTDPLQIEPEENPYITVSVSPVTVAVINNQPTLKQTLTATIQPATTENKEVDWTVAWADSTGVGDVTDYITVTPESNGSTNATVTCYKPFIEPGAGFLGADKKYENQAYIAKESVFFDFDIIQLTFNKEGIYTVIPVVADPIDAIGGITPPVDLPGELEWWQVVFALAMIILLILLLAPLWPYILKAILWVYDYIAKGVRAVARLIRDRKNKDKEE